MNNMVDPGSTTASNPAEPQIVPFLDLVRQVVQEQDTEAFATWYDGRGKQTDEYSFVRMWEEAGVIANHLRKWNVEKGDRVVLCYSFGLHFFATFLGCLRAGVVAVLVYPPIPPLTESLPKMNKVVSDCNAKLILIDSTIALGKRIDRWSPLSSSRHLWPNIAEWKVTDKLSWHGLTKFDDSVPAPTDLAFLQYTSGSTGEPKGVMVTFEALAANVKIIHIGYKQCFRDGMPERLTGFSWLPQYHDLGLIYATIAPFAGGFRMHMMSPIDFVKNPLLWIELMSKHRVHWGVAPDFAFNLVVRKFIEARDRKGKEPIPGLDLSTLHNLQNTAEPVKTSTKKNFEELFAPYGLRDGWFASGYGLAENTVCAAACFEFHLSSRDEDLHPFVAAGSRDVGDPGVCSLKVVDPVTCQEVPDVTTGEVWIGGICRAAGYFGKPDLSRETFGGKLVGDTSDRTFLRTGDLGFFQDGKLYICGRSKDIIIVNGANYYPQDVEAAVQEASPAVRPGCLAAFSSSETADAGAALEVVFEIRNNMLHDLADVVETVRRSIIASTKLSPHRVVAIRERSIPKTTSGKIKRRATRTALHEGALPVLLEWSNTGSTFGEDFFSAELLPDIGENDVTAFDDIMLISEHMRQYNVDGDLSELCRRLGQSAHKRTAPQHFAADSMDISEHSFCTDEVDIGDIASIRQSTEPEIPKEDKKESNESGPDAPGDGLVQYYAASFGNTSIQLPEAAVAAVCAIEANEEKLNDAFDHLGLSCIPEIAQEWNELDKSTSTIQAMCKTAMDAINKHNPVLVRFAHLLAAHPEWIQGQNGAEQLEGMIHQAFVLNWATTVLCASPDLIRKKMAFDSKSEMEALKDHKPVALPKDARFLVNGSEEDSLFGAVSLFLWMKHRTVGKTISSILEAEQQVGEAKSRTELLSQELFFINILEATWLDERQGFSDNAFVGKWAAARCHVSGMSGYKALIRQQSFAEVYSAWNMAFVMTLENPLLIAKLLIPCVSACEPEDFLWNRIVSLYLSSTTILPSALADQRNPILSSTPIEALGHLNRAWVRFLDPEYEHKTTPAPGWFRLFDSWNRISPATSTIGAVSKSIMPSEAQRQTRNLSASEMFEVVRNAVASLLGVNADDIPASLPLDQMGLTSMMAVELADQLGAATGEYIPTTLVYEGGSTVEDIVRYLNNMHDVPIDHPIDAASESSMEPIAVIGIACRLPGEVQSPEDFWKLLATNTDAIREVPPSRYDWREYYDPRSGRAGKTASKWGGFIEDIDGFDSRFFSMSTREAESLDPKARLLLECSFEAFEDAGLLRDDLLDSKTGVFLGSGESDFAIETFQNPTELDHYSLLGCSSAATAGRVSYVFGLRGPAMTIDTACSSGLVAVNQACSSLSAGECNMALVGGVNLVGPHVTVALSQTGVLSPTGRCHAFSADADGYVRADGCGVLLLKPLSAAIRDKDRIRGVIRGSACNQDGKSIGLSAPRGEAQQAVVRDALRRSGIPPSQVGYVECHGTGTKLGDPIEVNALGKVFAQDRGQGSNLIIGSVKSNIGHSEAASGVAALIKALLCLEKKSIPASLHASNLNPHIRFDRLPIEVATENTEWKPNGMPRVAGVSSFGISGTNAFVVVEEAPESLRSDYGSSPDSEEHVLPIVLSSHSPQATIIRATQLHSHLMTQPDVSIVNLGFTLATKRTLFQEHRVGIAASSRANLLEELELLAKGNLESCVEASDVSPNRKLCVLLSGQGTHHHGMGKDLYQTYESFRQAADECAKHFDEELELPLLTVMFAEPGTGEAALLDRSDFALTALFTFQYATFQLWSSWGVQPDMLIGHSVGEMVAATIAGMFDLGDACRLVATLIRLTKELSHNGSMLAVEASESKLLDLIKKLDGAVDIAAVNSQHQVVLSGPNETIEKLQEACRSIGLKAEKLNVDCGFHSRCMHPILGAFSEETSKVQQRMPVIPVIGCSECGLVDSDAMADGDFWSQQIRGTVRFADAVSVAQDRGADIFLELGPSSQLIDHMASKTSEEKLPSLVSTLKKEGSSEQQAFTRAACDLFCSGMAPLWDSAFPASARVVDLPTYPFDRQRVYRKPFGPGELASTSSGKMNNPRNGPSSAALTYSLTDCQRFLAGLLGGLPEHYDKSLSLHAAGFDSLSLMSLIRHINDVTGSSSFSPSCLRKDMVVEDIVKLIQNECAANLHRREGTTTASELASTHSLGRSGSHVQGIDREEAGKLVLPHFDEDDAVTHHGIESPPITWQRERMLAGVAFVATVGWWILSLYTFGSQEDPEQVLLYTVVVLFLCLLSRNFVYSKVSQGASWIPDPITFTHSLQQVPVVLAFIALFAAGTDTFLKFWGSILFGFYLFTFSNILISWDDCSVDFRRFYVVHHSLAFILTGAFRIPDDEWTDELALGVVVFLTSDIWNDLFILFRCIYGHDALSRWQTAYLQLAAFAAERLQRLATFCIAFFVDEKNALGYLLFSAGIAMEMWDIYFQAKRVLRQFRVAQRFTGQATLGSSRDLEMGMPSSTMAPQEDVP
ncbi:deoxyerythronolide-B synthase EryA1, modules 1 and 2 [Seminavis robusta]|uniref:Deoxyerythronolide-B synthase EryA1, modules 1 and 2 n=1 Tax=Seminavis robusta TaxID=568900 RepID=A0A9N8HUC0_9STRA|nr:deoxyerythronolide-B synthase EryA1, modules 1 and 2 [Seminavis robusta]|eukprot:Sro1636_g287590.1 deoxyerythronolide-B synthase EryA1, modules 1 and 2 (2528) ;mRNA; r:14431-22954